MKEVDDKAALEFAKIFYDQLFRANQSICTAYEISKKGISEEE